MGRPPTLLLAALALAYGCTPPAPVEDAGPPVSDPATAPLMAPPPVDRSPLPCAADGATDTPLPFGEVPRDARHLRPVVVEEPTAAPCIAPRRLLFGPPTDAPLRGSSLPSGGGVRFAPHFARSAAPLGLGPWALVAGPSGLWLYDLATMARRARLIAEPVLEVASSADGKRFAFLVEGGRTRDGADDATLVFASFPELARVRRFAGVPTGRLRMAPDGKRAVVAAGEAGLALFDADSGGNWRARIGDESIADARVHPRSPDRVIYVGDANRVGLRDMVAGEEIAQREGGGAPIFTRRDLRAVAYEASVDRTIAGGDDDLARVFQGLFGEQPRQVARVAMDGNVVDIGCCREGRFLVAAETGEVKWVDEGGEVLWELPALLPAALGEDVRVSPVSGTDVLLTVAGRVALWQPRRPLLAPDDYGMQASEQDVGSRDTLVMVPAAGRVILHRVSGPPALIAETELLGRPDWYEVTRVLRSPAGHRALLGRTARGTAIAFLPLGGELALPDPRRPDLGAEVEVRPSAGRSTWVARDAEGRTVTIDVDAQRIEATPAN